MEALRMNLIALILVLLALTAFGIVGYSFWLPRRNPDAFAGFVAPTRHEMRRFMLMGLYCNPEDPRPLVPHPEGRGWPKWTLNLRTEPLAVLFLTMLLLSGVTVIVMVLSAVLTSSAG
jgi:hypothetical protein